MEPLPAHERRGERRRAGETATLTRFVPRSSSADLGTRERRQPITALWAENREGSMLASYVVRCVLVAIAVAIVAASPVAGWDGYGG